MLKIFQKKPKEPRDTLAVFAEAKIPEFNTAAVKLLRVIRDPESGPGKIAEIAQWDPAMVLKMLKVVNSAAYGIRHEIASVAQAVTFLGRTQLESLVISAAVQGLVPAKPCPAFDAQRFWRTAGWRAALCRLLAKRLDANKADQYFLFGLLQDVSVPVIAQQLPERYDEVLSTWLQDQTVTLHELEQDQFGWDHSQVGESLADHWDLPASLRQAIAEHHLHDSGAGGRPALDLVAFIREGDVDTSIELLVRHGSQRYRLPEPWLVDIAREAHEKGAELAELMEA